MDASAVNDHHRFMAKRRDILKRFGSRVRSLRLETGLSQEKFAAKCGLDRTYVGSVERGERNIAIRNIEKIAKALRISISDLTKGL